MQPGREQGAQAYNSGEIDLIDLWLIFARHWKAFAITVFVGTALGAAYAFAKPEVYAYHTLVEIGTELVGNETRLIESPASLSAKLREGYRVIALRDFYETHQEIDKTFETDISVPDKSELVVIKNEVTAEYAEFVRDIHRRLVELVTQDHARIISLIRKGIENEIETTRNRLAELQDEEALLKVELERLQERHKNQLAILDERIDLIQAELKRLTDMEELVRQQIGDLQTLITQAQANRERAIQEADNAPGAMTLMLINDELQRNQKLLADLRERLAVSIPNQRSKYEQQIQELQKEKSILANNLANERDRFMQKITEIQRTQEEVQAKLDTLQLRLDNLRDTRAIAVAAQSIEPVGPGKVVLLALSIFASGFLGLIAVFVRHFSALVRNR